jgi:tripartite-type tricarboxylate transporter receptor subunit TctC
MNRSMQDNRACARNHAPFAERRQLLRAGVGGLAALASLSLGQRADAARGDPMHILCSGPAGSIPDLIARAVADQLFVTLGLRAVVDNRPGAAGQISVGALKGGAADGSTLLLAQGAIATVYPYLYAKLAYDPAVDLQPVSLASEMLLALAIGPAVPAAVATLAGFIAWLHKHPERANIGSPGTGTLPHLLEAMLFRKAGVAWQHVAYSGGPPAVTDLLAGQIAALALPEGLLRQHHAVGRAGDRHLRTCAQRLPAGGPVVRRAGVRRTGHQGVVRLLRLR